MKLGQFKKAVEDYDAALAMNVRKEEAHLYGRGLAKIKMGDKRGGEADLEEARKTSSRIDQDFAQYGVQ